MKIYKILLIIVIQLFFTACSTISKHYSYFTKSNISQLVAIGSLIDYENEISPLEYLEIRDKRNGTYKEHEIKLLSNEVKILYNNKIYAVPYSSSEDHDKINIYIRVYKSGLIITDDEFTVYLGKVQLDTGEIVEIPPLHLKKNIYIEKASIFNAVNPNGKIDRYYNTVEEYKKNGWKEEK